MDSPARLGFTPEDDPDGSKIDCPAIQARIRDGSCDRDFMCFALSPQQMQLVVGHALGCADCADYLYCHGSNQLIEMLNDARADAGEPTPVVIFPPGII